MGERVQGAPDLVVEVRSPGPRIGTLAVRVGWFARYGAREIWLYDRARRQMQVLTCADGIVQRTRVLDAGNAMQSGVLPGLTATVTALTIG